MDDLLRWATTGWRKEGTERTADGLVYDLILKYDSLVAQKTGVKRKRAPLGIIQRTSKAWKSFVSLLECLRQESIDPESFLIAQFSEPWPIAEGYPYPNMLLSNAAFTRYYKWQQNLGWRYRTEAAEAYADEQALVADAFEGVRRALEEGLYRYRAMPFKDIDRLVVLAPGALTSEFFLVWTSVRTAVESGRIGGIIAERWNELKEKPDIVTRMDEWAAFNGLVSV